MSNRITHHAALVYTMVLAATASGDISDRELRAMSELVSFLPVFEDFDPTRLNAKVQGCIDLLQKEDGLDEAIAIIRQALPEKLRETAYALALDVIASNGSAGQEELLLLEMLRHELDIDRLTAAAIETGARARYRVL